MDTRRARREAEAVYHRRRLTVLAGFGVIGLLTSALIALIIGIAGAGGVAGETEAAGETASSASSLAVTITELPPIRRVASIAAGLPAATGAPCEDPAVQAALAAGDDDGAVAALGGGAALREAVIAGEAPCVDLADATRLWVVVNKARPLVPEDYRPAALTDPASASAAAGSLRAEAAAAIDELIAAGAAAGAGDMVMSSGFRSYGTQVSTYSWHVRSYGQDGADAVSARPGYSEHQTGLAADIAACARGCGAIEDFGGTGQSDWVAEHAWEYGFIVRYEEGTTGITGYDPEPWHLRYVGRKIARAYQEGGFRTLEEFFGLPAAPGYGG